MTRADDVSRGVSRQQAEALAARAIREEKNLVTLVTEILEAAPAKGKA